MLIVGLGNPGSEYENTHHNVGFIMANAIAKDFKIDFHIEKKFQGQIATFNYNSQKHYLLEPLTYMNNSGQSVKKVMDYYKIPLEELFVIYDDMDLTFGKKRIRKNGSSGGHNGIKSIIKEVGSEEFKRLRIGIGHGKDTSNEGVIDFVLSKFNSQEKTIIQEIIKEVPDIIKDLIDNDITYIMNKYN